MLVSGESKLILGLVFLGVIILFLGSYVAWNKRKHKKGIRSAADEDAKLVHSGKMSKPQLTEKIQSVVSSVLIANATLAGITIAAVFIVIALNASGQMQLQGMKQWIMLTGLVLSAVSAVCWLVGIEQLTQMKAPSVDFDRLLKFQKYTYGLRVIGLVLLSIALYLLLLLAHPYVAMIFGVAIVLVVVRYWKIHNDW